jgi:hypothetical protein
MRAIEPDLPVGHASSSIPAWGPNFACINSARRTDACASMRRDGPHVSRRASSSDSRRLALHSFAAARYDLVQTPLQQRA